MRFFLNLNIHFEIFVKIKIITLSNHKQLFLYLHVMSFIIGSFVEKYSLNS